MAADTAPVKLTEGEKSFVEKVAQYYYENDGMPHDRGRVVGWMMICDPAAQTAGQIAEVLGVPRAAIDRIVDQLTPENDPVSVFERTGSLTEDYTIRLRENSWAPKVRGIFSEFPDFHRVARAGLDGLRAEGAAEERLLRLSNMERFLAFVSAEMPAILERYEKQKSAGQAG
ncbi:hypothetical protein DEJ50_28605 [Streptomyces venezuelae]|uniref:MarR family transcriptional regulator n=1 Tax=Streptomyces venezuelae TaxID=54571 RepID=A0A5P2D9I8_STRVZ|nr:hypothetical protein [Streptomyces venezuelae]QES51210.1 hypothetical protein DEJ50_28605 [Streptomyces venezuelae]